MNRNEEQRQQFENYQQQVYQIKHQIQQQQQQKLQQLHDEFEKSTSNSTTLTTCSNNCTVNEQPQQQQNRHRRRRVEFSDNENQIIQIESLEYYLCDKKLMKQLWYNNEDFLYFKSKNAKLVTKFSLGLLTEGKNSKHTQRGLEFYTTDPMEEGGYDCKKRYQCLLSSIRAVLREQQLQRQHGMYYDDTMIANAYIQSGGPITCSDMAILRGKRDYESCLQCYDKHTIFALYSKQNLDTTDMDSVAGNSTNLSSSLSHSLDTTTRKVFKQAEKATNCFRKMLST